MNLGALIDPLGCSRWRIGNSAVQSSYTYDYFAVFYTPRQRETMRQQ